MTRARFLPRLGCFAFALTMFAATALWLYVLPAVQPVGAMTQAGAEAMALALAACHLGIGALFGWRAVR